MEMVEQFKNAQAFLIIFKCENEGIGTVKKVYLQLNEKNSSRIIKPLEIFDGISFKNYASSILLRFPDILLAHC